MPITRPHLSDRARTIGMFAMAAIVLTAGLGTYGLWDPDEGRHSAIARAVYAATSWRGWLIPTRNFADYHDKPILYYWLTSLAYALVGPTEVGARLVPVVSALATLVAIFLWTRRVWDARTAQRAVLVLLTSVGFLGLGRYGNLDMLVSMWITVGLVAAERCTAAPERRGPLVLAAAAAGFGMLAKGLAAPLFIVVVPVLHAWLTGRRLPPPRAWLIAATVSLLVAGPWYVAVGIVDPDYLRDFFIVHHLHRFAADTTTFHAAPWWYYGPALALMLFPWSLLLPATLATVPSRRDEGVIFCLCWAAVVVGFFSCSHGKLATYILPALPPLAVVTARAFEALDATRLGRRLTAGGLATLMLVLAAGTVVIYRLRTHTVLIDGLRTYAPLLPAVAILLALAWWRRGLAVATRLVAPGVVALALVFYLGIATSVSRMASEQAIATTIASRSDDVPILSYEVTPASLMFYVQRPIVRLSRPKALRAALAEQPPFVWIVTSPRHVEAIQGVVPVYPWVTIGRHVLYATQPADAVAETSRERAAD